MKKLLKRGLRKAGLIVASQDRLGLEVELDLARFTASAPLDTIFDVGANLGQSARRFAKAFPTATIYSFEPVTTTYAELEASVASLPQVRPWNLALGVEAGTAQINLANHSGANSLMKVRAPTGSETIQVETLDTFADSQNIERVDLLKIDVEGFELEVLAGAKRRLAERRIRYIYAECVMEDDPDMPHTTFFDLHNILKPLGFPS